MNGWNKLRRNRALHVNNLIKRGHLRNATIGQVYRSYRAGHY